MRVMPCLATTISMITMMTVVIVSNENGSASSRFGNYTELKTSGNKRNVETTGKYALFTKPERAKGAKQVLSKTILKKMGSYTKADYEDYVSRHFHNRAYKGSRYYLRAYGYKKGTDGSIYYRVVTMNGKYRGYIYGGKRLNKFSGGLRWAQTTKSQPINPEIDVNEPYFLNFKPVLTAPAFTQYKAKIVTDDYPKYSQDELKIVKNHVIIRTRERDRFFYVQDLKHPAIKGWTQGLSTDYQE